MLGECQGGLLGPCVGERGPSADDRRRFSTDVAADAVAFCGAVAQIFHSLFKTLQGKPVVVELKNDLRIRGTLHSVDQFLNIKLEAISVDRSDSCPHLSAVKDCFVRGSVVRYIELPPDAVNVDALHDACRRESKELKKTVQ